MSIYFQIKATDNDIGENAIVTYSIYHVSNNGANKFKIDPDTGIIGKDLFLFIYISVI